MTTDDQLAVSSISALSLAVLRRLLAPVAALALAVPGGAAEHTRVIPAAARAAGSEGSFFVTDLRLLNASADAAIQVRIDFLERDADNRTATGVTFDVAAGAGLAIDDVVTELIGRDGAGGLRLVADGRFHVVTRTYSAGGDAGTFGQFIPGQSPQEAMESGMLLSVQNVPGDSGARSNIGFANPSDDLVQITVTLIDLASGEVVGERARNVRPWAVAQINDVFRWIGDGQRVTEHAMVRFEASSAVLAYASILDNASNDPIYVLPFAAADPAGANQPPKGVILEPPGDVTIAAGEAVTFTATASDPDGDAVTVRWQYGDGISAGGLTPAPHVYEAPGTYTPTLTATDEHGLADPEPATISVTVTESGTGAFDQIQTTILTPKCSSSQCHGTERQAGLSLVEGEAYSNLVDVPSTQSSFRDRVEPGSPDESYMYLKLIDDPTIVGHHMPPSRQLSDDLIEMVHDWIEAGAPEN